MGMDFGDGPDHDAVHKERVAVASKKKDIVEEKPKELSYAIISCISLNGVDHQLLIGEDYRWYKAKKIGEYRRDEKNRSPLIPIFGEVEPFSEEDKKYFM